MNLDDDLRFVAHIDILGMSTLVENNLEEAWGLLSALVEVKDQNLNFGYEFMETQEYLRVSEHFKTILFSDTLLFFSKGATDIELKSMIVLISEIFHKSLCKCIPVRAGIALGQFRFNLERSMYAGPALIEAYQAGEATQWLGVTFADSASIKAASLGMKSLNSDIVVKWPVPTKQGTQNKYVVNWPAIFAHDLDTELPVTLEKFYSAFEPTFGPINSLSPDVRVKYENTVHFMNTKLELLRAT